MRREIEHRYRASLSQPIPVGVEETKLKEAYGAVPFVVGKLESGKTKAITLGGIFSLREIHLLADHLRTHHNLQIQEVLAHGNDQTKVTVLKAEKSGNHHRRQQMQKDRHVKMKF